MANNNDYIRYFLISDGSNDYSIGRLVRRIHVLSELKSIAFVERHTVTDAYGCILDIGAALSTIIEKLTDPISPTLPFSRINQLNAVWNDLGRSPASFNKEGFKTESISSLRGKKLTYRKCLGGFSYRINRSMYYYDELLNRLDDLRVERLKGFEPYDRFIHRNYHQMIEAIKSIGERRAALDARIDRMQSLAYTLQQRMVAQYALLFPVFLAGIPAYGWIKTLFEEDQFGLIKTTLGWTCKKPLSVFDLEIAASTCGSSSTQVTAPLL
jgi:hypothetical protein